MKRNTAIFAVWVLLLSTGCRSAAGPTAAPLPPPAETAAASPQPTETAAPTPPPAPTPPSVVSPADTAELSVLFTKAMEAMEQPPLLDLSGCSLEGPPEMALKNIYYAIVSKRPELKYTYDLTAEPSSDGLTKCTLAYMPYKLGLAESGVPISSLQSLISAAREGLGGGSTPIRITDTDLDVDDMGRALQQVGSGYLVCTLNRDATAVDYAPATGYTMEECLTLLEEAESSARALVDKLITPDMDEQARMEALYGWLTDNVSYDQRYYSDRASMPFQSTTATGAFQDSLAICGGYSHALELLCRAAGLEVLTVSGQGSGESHAWNLVRVDDTWRYYDPTFDRGRRQYGYLYFGVDAETLGANHQWNEAFYLELTE